MRAFALYLWIFDGGLEILMARVVMFSMQVVVDVKYAVR